MKTNNQRKVPLTVDHDAVIDKLTKRLAKRWAGKDMETYFIEKSKAFGQRLKNELSSSMSK